MNYVDVIYPLIGGLLIGLAATLLLLFKGRIFGVTGIVSQLLEKPTRENDWRVALVPGILTGSFGVFLFRPDFFQYQIPSSLFEMVIAGGLVGFGTRLGSGCTSGHGVCGLPRLSLRSLVATLSFMIVGIITVYLRGA